MTLPLWMLLAFACWTLLILLLGIGIYRWSLILTGQAELVSFPGDLPHGGTAYRRIVRAHANCVENLPVFAVIVLVATVAHLNPPYFGELAVVTVIGRVCQSLVHMVFPISNPSVAVRFSFLVVQLVAMIAMVYLIVMPAIS